MTQIRAIEDSHPPFGFFYYFFKSYVIIPFPSK